VLRRNTLRTTSSYARPRRPRPLRDEWIAAIVTLVAMIFWGGLLHMLDREESR